MVCNGQVRDHFQQQKKEEQWGTRYLLDDVLKTRLNRARFHMIHDSGVLDSIAMTLPEGASRERAPFEPPEPVSQESLDEWEGNSLSA